MSGAWKPVFEGTVEGRHVELEIHDEGAYLVHTTRHDDDPGSVKVDQFSTTIIYPTEKGAEIIVHGETAAELHRALVAARFSENAASEIIGKARAQAGAPALRGFWQRTLNSLKKLAQKK